MPTYSRTNGVHALFAHLFALNQPCGVISFQFQLVPCRRLNHALLIVIHPAVTPDEGRSQIPAACWNTDEPRRRYWCRRWTMCAWMHVFDAYRTSFKTTPDLIPPPSKCRKNNLWYDTSQLCVEIIWKQAIATGILTICVSKNTNCSRWEPLFLSYPSFLIFLFTHKDSKIHYLWTKSLFQANFSSYSKKKLPSSQ